MSQNLVDLVDFVFHSQRRVEILNKCTSQNVVDFVFHSQTWLTLVFLVREGLKCSNICMSQKVVDLVDLGFPLIKVPKSKYVYVPKRG